jgi:hypothetical protein
MSANTRLDSLPDLVRHKANVQASCACGRTHVFDAMRMRRYAILRNWNSQLEALRYHIRCRSCGRRGVLLKATPLPPTPADPFPTSEAEWKRLERRLRG